MKNSEQIQGAIVERLGFFPPFFEPAQDTPEVLENLWHQTLSAYLNNPLPFLFKEKLFAYLSRYCSVPYCIICHSCALRPLGMTAQEVLTLLQEPTSHITNDLKVQLAILNEQTEELTTWPPLNSTLERSLYCYSILLYLKPYDAKHYRTKLRRLLGSVYYNHLMSFIAYIKTCHQWVESYPELVYEADQRAQLHLTALLQEEPALADFFTNYHEKVRQEGQNQEEQLTTQIVALQQQVKTTSHRKNNILQTLIEDTSDAIFVKDLQGRYLLANSATARMFGKPIEEIIGKDHSELFQPEDAHKIRETDRRIMRSGQTESVEQAFTLNGITRTYLSTKDAYRDRMGNVIGLIGIAREITEQKRLEAEREHLLEVQRELISSLQQQTKDLAALSAVTANAISTLNLEELLNVLLQRIVTVLSADVGMILLKEDDRLCVRASIGVEEEALSGFAVPIGSGFAGTVAATMKVLYLEDAQTDSRVTSPVIKQLGIHTMLGVPLKRNNTFVGVLHVDWLSIHPFSAQELHLLEIVAERCTMAILNAQLYEQTKHLKERLQLQIDTMPIGCLVLDREGRITDWNPAAEKIFACPKAEILGKVPDWIADASTQPKFQEIMQRLLAGEKTVKSINKNNTKDGRTIICDWQNSLLKDADGNVMGFLCMVQDITEQMQAEADLQQANQRLRFHVENSPLAVVEWDAEGMITGWSGQAERIFGWTAEQVVGRHWWDFQFVFEEDIEVVNLMLERLASRDRPRYINRHRNYTKDGRIIHCEWYTSALRDESGNLVSLLFLVLDVTKRKQAEEGLRHNEKLLRNVLNTVPIGIWIADPYGNLVYANPAGQDIWGGSRHVGLTQYSQYKGWWRDTGKRIEPQEWAIFRAISKGEVSLDEEIDIECLDGTRKIILSSAAPIHDANQEIVGAIAVNQDISDRKRAEVALRESEQRFRSLIENSSDIILILDENRAYRYVSHSVERILGYKPADLIGKMMAEFIHPDDFLLIAQTLNQAVENPQVSQKQIEYRVRHNNGSWRIFEAVVTSLLDNPAVKGVVGNCRDITEGKQAQEALRQSEHKYYTLAKILPVGIFRTDSEGEIIYVNERWCQISGLTLEQSLGASWTKPIYPEDRELVLAEWWQVVQDNMPLRIEYRLQRPDGGITWVFVQAIAEIGSDRKVIGYVGSVTDITERKQVEEQLRYYAFYDPLTGLPNRALFLKHLRQLMLDIRRGSTSVLSARSQAATENFPYPITHVLDPISQTPQLFAVLFLELNRFQIIKYSLGHLFADQLIIATSSRIQACLSNFGVPILDCDLGHICEISETLVLPDQTNNLKFKIQNLKFTVARLGLDEFAILLADLQNINDALSIADCLYQALQLPFNLEGRQVFVTGSIGIAPSSIGYEKAEDFLRAADTAMHHAKESSKAGGYTVFEPEWHSGAVERLQLETDLRWAIERQQLRVYYQPIVSLKSRRITGFEALVRWHHPTRGLVSPGEFIPLAEETGLISLIDRWVLCEACRQIAIWQQAFPSDPPLTISVNLSGSQLGQLNLVESIDQILRETGVERGSVKLEITESQLTGNTASEMVTLNRLKALGIQLLIDDFGTGYSSLARLNQMPIDTLKIDRSFVSQMSVDSESLEIVRTILTLAHSLGMDAIAEGVETAEQLAQLRALQCEYGQGYFFSKPIDSEAVWALLNR